MAALKRTIDNAPTKPKESATEGFTITIIDIVVSAKGTKFAAKRPRLETALPKRI